MKFIIIFISLLMIIFGGLFSYCSWEDDVVKQIKLKIGYESLDIGKQSKADKILKDLSTYCFLTCIIGFCLFIAGLFI